MSGIIGDSFRTSKFNFEILCSFNHQDNRNFGGGKLIRVFVLCFYAFVILIFNFLVHLSKNMLDPEKSYDELRNPGMKLFLCHFIPY